MVQTYASDDRNMCRNKDYQRLLRQTLTRPTRPAEGSFTVCDLFAGCGGLSLGFEIAGFRTTGFESSAVACQTYRQNLKADCHETILDTKTLVEGQPDVLIGGPPCQPFSVSGLQNGRHDKRNGFPAFIAVVERTKPRMVIFENVDGLRRKGSRYLDSIMKRLKTIGYKVEPPQTLNACDYGVPQNRKRLFVVAHEGIWTWPEPTFSNMPYSAGDALDDLDSQSSEGGGGFLTRSMDRYVRRYENASKCKTPRDLHLDRPSRTLTCRNLAGFTGDMLRLKIKDGRRRLLTIREAARLQSFPDWFKFSGTEAQQLTQIGNAVPPLISAAIAKAALTSLLGAPPSLLMPASYSKAA